jgi:hypothetical protein
MLGLIDPDQSIIARKRAEAINARALEDALDSASRAAAHLAGVKVRIEQSVYPCGIVFRGSLTVGQGGMPPRPGNAKTGNAKTGNA